MVDPIFEWDQRKNEINLAKHGISFYVAQRAFLDPHRIIAEDIAHSSGHEKRYFCFGKIEQEIFSLKQKIKDLEEKIAVHTTTVEDDFDRYAF